MKLRLTPLGNFIEEARMRLGKNQRAIYSVTNDRGFVPSHEVFDKQVFSADTSAYKIVEYKNLAYNPSRINVGSIAICQNQNGGAVSPMYVIVRCREGLLPEYLLYFLKSPLGFSQINHRTEGAVRFQLKFQNLKQIPIYLPSIPEQQRIVRILDEADALCQLRAHADKRTNDFVPALFNEMFGDPATNPKNRERVRVGDLLILCEYGTSDKANDEGRGIAVLRMGNVTENGSFDLSSLKYVELSEDERAKYLLQVGDVLFNRTNSRELVGKTGMWDGRFDAVAASYFIRIRFDLDREHPQHFTTLMNLPLMKRRLAEMARGAIGQANINAQELRSIEFPLPPLALQREFAARVAEVRALQAQQARSRQRLEDLFQALLHRAFAGEL